MQKVKKRIPVGILGATGMVGQKFIELLTDHPWFEIVALVASEKSAGKTYAELVKWMMPTPLDSKIGRMILHPCRPNLPCSLVFSSLNSTVAGQIEQEFAQAGYCVVSNSSAHRMRAEVPLVIPEVNPTHLKLIKTQNLPGQIITNPNCSVIGLAIALKPILQNWGIEKCFVVTLQAISGAGYPGIAAYDIMDNVIPYIANEEEKIEQEIQKILGSFKNDHVENYPLRISAQCNRVAVMDGHMASISVQLKQKADRLDILNGWKEFSSQHLPLNLPSASHPTIIYHENPSHPQPKVHRLLNQGMSVSIGGLRECALLDWKFNILSHNTIRGAAGCAILNAELMVRQEYLKDVCTR